MHNFIVSLAQLNFLVGNFKSNTSKIVQAINEAKKENVNLIVFPELSVCGATPCDLLFRADFIESCEKSISEIAAHCIGIAAIVGSPHYEDINGKRVLYNSAFFLADGKVKGINHKKNLNNSDVSYESRYFEKGTKNNKITYNNVEIDFVISDDIQYLNWSNQTSKICINIAATPFYKNKLETQKQLLIDAGNKLQMPIFYVNQLSAQPQLLFEGGSMMYDFKNNDLDVLPLFEESRKNYVVDLLSLTVTLPKTIDSHPLNCEISRIQSALIYGVREFFKNQNFSKAILGLSGGIDSAVVLTIAAKALGAENVKAILLPSKFSTSHSIDDAKKLALNLGVSYDIISIENTCDTIENTLQPYFKDTTFDTTEENIQARSRALLLMALSNKFEYILLNTSNKSEAAVGYGTLYGDLCGALSILGDLYKTDVYALAKHINKEKEIIPDNILTKEPSAELHHGQKDSDSLPEYSILDKILYQYIEAKKDINEIVNMGFDEDVVKRVVSLVNANEWKRFQAPPIIKLSEKAFGSGRLIPLIAKY
ncbi:MAG: NAD+ synthase [Bacteroidia bacterium]|nr:NAD+ synthase [Bacteroidia bacterium]